jgi:3-(3-hydroxy-phenyl)propionate hydroxylase
MPRMQTAIADVAAWDWVRPRLVLGKANAATDDLIALWDLDGVAHGLYGLDGRPALILVRPDGHIAFRGPADDPTLLRHYCERVFGKVAARCPA